MTRFIELTADDGQAVHVNPDHIVSVAPAKPGTSGSEVQTVADCIWAVESPDKVMFEIRSARRTGEGS